MPGRHGGEEDGAVGVNADVTVAGRGLEQELGEQESLQGCGSERGEPRIGY